MLWGIRRSGFATLTLTLLLSGCGGSDDDLERAREQGAREARLQERQKQQRARQRELERKIKELEEKQRQGGSSSGGSAGSSAPSTGRTSCGDGLTVGPNTTCAFAREVRAEYERTQSSTISAYSPVTGKTYTMTCSHGSPHVCVGGNNASVYFP